MLPTKQYHRESNPEYFKGKNKKQKNPENFWVSKLATGLLFTLISMKFVNGHTDQNEKLFPE